MPNQPLRPIKNVIFMGRKIGAVKAAKWLLRKSINIKLIVTRQDDFTGIDLEKFAQRKQIPLFFDDKPVYKMIDAGDALVSDIDLVISYLYWKKIKLPLIKLGKAGCVNFHPAPLPDYKSSAGYNMAILEQKNDFGVSAHFVNSEEFDAGPIIKVLKFAINPEQETAFSLENKTQEKLLELFIQTMELFLSGQTIPTIENIGGLYLTKKQLEELKAVDLAKDTSEEIDRKIRAFFFPPYSGAKIIVNGQEFTLVTKEILEYIAGLIRKADV